MLLTKLQLKQFAPDRLLSMLVFVLGRISSISHYFKGAPGTGISQEEQEKLTKQYEEYQQKLEKQKQE